MIADGVKGLLRISKESFVVCALRMEAASKRSARGFGEEEEVVVLVGFAAEGSLRALSKLSRRNLVEAIDFCRAERWSFSIAEVKMRNRCDCVRCVELDPGHREAPFKVLQHRHSYPSFVHG